MVQVRRFGMLLAAVLATGSVAGCDRGDEPSAASSTSIPTTSMPAPPPVSTTGSQPSTTAVTTTASATSAPSSSTSTTLPAEMAISRPYLDPSICRATAAWESRFEDHTIDFLFWIRTDEPISLQVVGDPELGTSGPFAMVLRYPVQLGDVDDGQRQLMTIADLTVGVISYPNGNGDAMWNLPDGSQAYLRARDLAFDEIVAVVASLMPRLSDAEIPGFDVDKSATLPLLTEHMNSGIDGRSAGFTCETDHEPPREYRVDAYDAEPVYEYLAILDRARPMDAGNVDGTTVVVGYGLTDETTPRVDDVVNADEATWNALLQQPPP